jgi:aspartyl-tRNA(Asn)/glutamyl-tRNA(Gln) amidotransferase subunit A
MARTCADAGAVLAAIAGRDPRDPTSVDAPASPSRPIEGLRIGVPRRFVESSPSLDRATLELYDDALDRLAALGTAVREIDLPDVESEFAVYTVIVTVEAYRAYADVVRGQATLLRPSLHNRVITGAVFTPEQYALARRGRTVLVEAMRGVMHDVDVLCLPTAPHVAPTWEEEQRAPDWKRPSFRRLFNITGQPALSVPAGLAPEGLPVGVQFVGRWFEEATVLALGSAFEQVRRVRELRPPIEVREAAGATS